MPEVITFIPVIENKFGLDGAEVEKIIHRKRKSVTLSADAKVQGSLYE